jgi:hypothetical protein
MSTTPPVGPAEQPPVGPAEEPPVKRTETPAATPSPPRAPQWSLSSPRLFAIIGAVIVGVVLLGNAGIGLPGAPMVPRGASTDAHAAPASGVPWQEYESGVKSRIDTMTRLRDCADLKRQLKAARAGNEATIAATGHDNAALIAYIEAAMQDAECGSN